MANPNELEDVVAEYLGLKDRGEAPPVGEFLDRYPHLEKELLGFFNNQNAFDRLAEPIRQIQTSMTSAESRSDVQLDGFEIIEEIGRGGMGVIYKARQIELRRIVALKMIHRDRLSDVSDIERFQREAKAAASLEHPNIVPIYEVGEQNGYQFFTMKLATGGNLQERVQAGLEIKRLVVVLEQVARAIHHAHLQGVLHRDLKPSNILVDTPVGETAAYSKTTAPNKKDEIPRSACSEIKALVTDFGLAKQIGFDGDLTATGAVLGTPNFMAPEQAMGSGSVTAQTDVHGLGVILYYMLTGVPPFRGEDLLDVLDQVKNSEPTPPRKLNPRIDRDLETLCLKCLEKEPPKRYATANEVAEELQRFLHHQPLIARPAGWLERGRRWVKRDPKLAALIMTSAMVLVAILAGLIATNIFTSHEKTKTQLALNELKKEQQSTKKALWNSSVAEARAHRWSGQAGYRFRALGALDRATRLLSEFGSDEASLVTLRNEFVSAWAIPIDLRPTGQKINVQEYNPEPYSFDYSPELKCVASGGLSGTVSLYSIASGHQIGKLSGPESIVRNVRFLKRGTLLAVVHENLRLNLWDVSASPPKIIWTSQCEWDGFDVQPNHKELAVAVPGQGIEFFDLSTLERTKKIELADSIWSLRFNHQGSHLAMAGRKGVKIIELASNKMVWSRYPGNSVYSIGFSPDDVKFYGTSQGNVMQVDTKTWRQEGGRMMERTDEVPLIQALGGTRHQLVSVLKNRSMVIQTNKNSMPLLLQGRFRSTHPDSRYISFRNRNEITLWEVAKADQVHSPVLSGLSHKVVDLDFCADQKLCATCGNNGVSIIQLESFKEILHLPLFRTDFVKFSPCGQSLVTGGNVGVLRWPIKVDEESQTFTFGPPVRVLSTQYTFTPLQLTYSKNGSTLAVFGKKRYGFPDEKSLIHVFDRQDCVRHTLEFGTSIQETSLSEDGKWLAVSFQDQPGISIWSTESGDRIKTLELSFGAKHAFFKNVFQVCEPGGKISEFEVKSWELQNSCPVKNLAGFANSETSKIVALVKTGGHFDLCADDLTTPLVRLNDDSLESEVKKFRFSPDGRLLGAAFGRDEIRIWNIGKISSDLNRKEIGWGRNAGAQDTLTVPRPMTAKVQYGQAQNGSGHFFSIDLSKVSNKRLKKPIADKSSKVVPKEGFQFLPKGKMTLAGIPFEIGSGFIFLRKVDQLNHSGKIEINRKLERIHLLHGVIWGQGARQNEIADYQVRYSDGTETHFGVFNFRDVVDYRNQVHLFDPELNPPAILFRRFNGGIGHARVKSWENPFPNKTVSHISMVLKHQTMAPFCLAVTIESK